MDIEKAACIGATYIGLCKYMYEWMDNFVLVISEFTFLPEKKYVE